MSRCLEEQDWLEELSRSVTMTFLLGMFFCLVLRVLLDQVLSIRVPKRKQLAQAPCQARPGIFIHSVFLDIGALVLTW